MAEADPEGATAPGLLARARAFVDPRAMVAGVRDQWDRQSRDLEEAVLRVVRPGLERGETIRMSALERRRVPRGHDVAELALLGTVVAAAVALAPSGTDWDAPEPASVSERGSMHCGLWLTDRRLIALGYKLRAAQVGGRSGWDAVYGWVARAVAARSYPLSALPDVAVKGSLATVALNLGEPAVPRFEVLYFRYQREAIAAAEAFAAEVQRLREDRRVGPYR